MITWNQAFDEVLREFKVQAKWLSQVSGVSEYTISQFRKGHKEATTGTLNKLLAPLPQDARERFFFLLLGYSPSAVQVPPLEKQIENLSKESKKKLVMVIVESLACESRQSVELVK